MNSQNIQLINRNENSSLINKSATSAAINTVVIAASDLIRTDTKCELMLNEQNDRMQLNADANQIDDNLKSSSTKATKSGLRSQSLTTKNFFDYNFQSQQHMLILSNTSPSKSSSIDVFQLNNNQKQINNMSINSHFNNHPNHYSPKIINDSNKILENILTNTKRNFKQATSLNLLSPNSGNAQVVSLSASFSNHVNLPATVLTISRTNEERFLFPDKLILERRNLNACPIIDGDDQLKLINYQHNQIRSIQNLDQMRSLIFLDLYDNRIERINGLSNLVNLRVLMLGKNRIEKIENLDSLVYLDVLDLHGNQITHIENLACLHELRVLNIAANQIKVVENLNGLHSLVELNLRRNQIYEINDLENCSKLQRLFLSFNEIMSLMSIKNLSTINNLQELSLDNNPISIEKNYKRNVLAQLISLKKLDSKKVTDEEKRIAERMFLKSEFKKRELENYYFLEEKRKTIIRDAKSEWFAQQTNQKEKTSLDFNPQKEPTVVTLNCNEIESKLIVTNDDSDIKTHMSLERMNSKSFGSILSNSNITFQKPNQQKQQQQQQISSSMLNYQNYLQQYQNQSQLSNSNKINAKLKIVTMRSVSQFPSQNSLSTQNFNLISSSSSSSLHSIENETKQAEPIQSNENETEGDFQRAQAILLSRSNSASSQISKIASNATNQNNSATISASNIRRSITYNSGSNIHEDSIMYFYGIKSLEILDNKLESILTAQIMTISFHYIDYDDNLCKCLARIKFKFPSVVNLIFTCCNIKSLNQIDSLIEWKRLDSLTVNKDDNPIYSISIWTHYTIFRLNCLQLKRLNDKLISPEDVTIANKLLNTYLNWALYLPEYKLVALLGQDRKKLIKIAKEKFNDPSSVPTQEQINARETIIKVVSAANNQQFKAVNTISVSTPTTITQPNLTFVSSVFSQMSYNDYKKQKIKSLQTSIWSKVMEQNLQNSNRKDKHILNICKKKKFRI